MAYRDEGSIQQFYESLVRRLDQVEAAVREVAQDSGVDISVIEALLADVDFSEFVSLSHDDLSDVTAVNHHVRYSDAEAVVAVGPHFSGDHDDLSNVTANQHHTRYDDTEAVSAMGVEDDANPLNHARYADSEAIAAVGPHTVQTYLHDDLTDVTASQHHARYTDAEAISAVSVVTDHGALSGLTPDDDHPQYLLVNGTRAMTGDLNMDGNDLLDVTSIGYPTITPVDANDRMYAGSNPAEGIQAWSVYQYDDSAAAYLLRFQVAPYDPANGWTGAIRFFDLDGNAVLLWDPSDDRWEFETRPYSSADSALLEVVGHAHSTLSGVGADDHHAKYTDAEAATQADTQIAAAAVGDLSDVTEWTDWTPSYPGLTVGNGTVVARYTKIGGTVTCDFAFTLGSTSSMGNGTVSLPVEASASYDMADNAVGQAYFAENGSTDHVGVARLESSTTMRPIVVNGTYAAIASVNATIPHTWGTDDILYMRLTYEAA